MTDQLEAQWNDLSTGELRARLEQRGYTDPIVGHWLGTREHPDTIEALNAVLGGR